ncbi:hypothetical protein [Micromonospora aurantiaca (nom. illeg.)]|uniref:hypothetical protein n=1 Tax=Micromonospora aurantiaca (nom. illeg.) TaxID=47850 RepID=UPI003F4A000D
MADEFKGVIVQIGGPVNEGFAGANDFVVRNEGHLFVLRDDETVAIFAPGKWASVKLKD